mmetsp:Transcript_16911/g.36781  ORF Transcript_16911/g.36781 Transcript_16911/m.36781 type:complete len:102 (-) Transcript_16911:1462-1767(-)
MASPWRSRWSVEMREEAAEAWDPGSAGVLPAAGGRLLRGSPLEVVLWVAGAGAPVLADVVADVVWVDVADAVADGARGGRARVLLIWMRSLTRITTWRAER